MHADRREKPRLWLSMSPIVIVDLKRESNYSSTGKCKDTTDRECCGTVRLLIGGDSRGGVRGGDRTRRTSGSSAGGHGNYGSVRLVSARGYMSGSPPAQVFAWSVMAVACSSALHDLRTQADAAAWNAVDLHKHAVSALS